MPWKENYTRSDEKSLNDSDVRWPDGHHCCATITVDSAWPLGRRVSARPTFRMPRRYSVCMTEPIRFWRCWNTSARRRRLSYQQR